MASGGNTKKTEKGRNGAKVSPELQPKSVTIDLSDQEDKKENDIMENVKNIVHAPPPLPKWLTRFASSTTIHGFAYTTEPVSRRRWEGVFWAILMLVITGVVIAFLAALFNDYMSSPTVTDTSLEFKGNLWLPKTTVCIPMIEEALMTDGLNWANLKHRLDVLLQTSVNNVSFYKSSWEKLDPNNVLMVTSIIMLSRITEVENLYLVNISDHRDQHDSSAWITEPIQDQQDKAVSILKEFLDKSSLSANLSRIATKIGLEICQRINMEVKIELNDGSIEEVTVWNICNATDLDVSWVGKKFLCYRLPLQRASLDSRDDYATVTLNLKPLYPQWERFKRLHVIRYGRAPAIWFDLRGTTKFRESSDLAFPIELGRKFHASLEISGIYSSQEEDGVCQTVTTLDECQENCYANIHRKMCPDCYPFSRYDKDFTLHDKDKSEEGAEKVHQFRHCTLDDYKNCLKYDPGDVKACTKSCKENCLQTTYRINWKEFADIPRMWSTNGLESSEIQQKLSLHTFVYPVFTETTTVTLQGMVADVGGIVGLWIGCSIITVIHSLIFCAYEGALCCMGREGRITEAQKRSEAEAALGAEKAKAAEVVNQKDIEKMEEELGVKKELLTWHMGLVNGK